MWCATMALNGLIGAGAVHDWSTHMIGHELTGLFGIKLEGAHGGNLEVAPFVELILDIRNELRNSKQWELSDKLRDKLLDIGIVVEDADEGSTWKFS